jgi:Ras homolog enriched in brain
VPICVVGNKSDLHMQRYLLYPAADLICRQVKPEEGRMLAEEWNCAWTEASARHNENVTKAFELILGEVEKQNAPPEEEKSKCTIF